MLKKLLVAASLFSFSLAAQANQLPVVNLTPPGNADGVAVYCVKHDNNRQAIICSATDPLNVALVGGSISVGSVTSQATAAAAPPTYTAGGQNQSQTLSGGLRVQLNFGSTDLALGQTTKAGSIPVTIASDQGALGSVSVTGTLPAFAVPPVVDVGTAGALTQVAVTCGATDTLLLAALSATKFLEIKVPSAATNTVWINYTGATATAATPNEDLTAGQAHIWDNNIPTGQLRCISAPGAQSVSLLYR